MITKDLTDLPYESYPYTYTLDFKHVFDGWENYDRIIEWSLDHIGVENQDFAATGLIFYFKRYEDLIQFALAWA